MPVYDPKSLAGQYQTTQEGARLANLKRAEQVTAIYDEIIRRYQPGGAFQELGLGQLEKQKRRGVGQEMQHMISAGLYGTTTAGGIGRQWEETVGEPGRLRLEDIMMQRLSTAQTGKAGFLERIEEPYPDYGAVMGAVAQPSVPTTRQTADKTPSPWEAEYMGGGWSLSDVGTRPPREREAGGTVTGGGLSPTKAAEIQRKPVPVPKTPYEQAMGPVGESTIAPGTTIYDVAARGGGGLEGEYKQWQQTQLADLEKQYAKYRGPGGEITDTNLSGGYGYRKGGILGVSLEQWKRRVKGM